MGKQAEHALTKGRRLVSCFKFLRKYLTESQFLKAATANYYGTVFYASSVWYQNIKQTHKNKFDTIHFRMLRTATRQRESETTRDSLSRRCERATPKEWVQYLTASLVMKTIRDQQPKPLFDLLMNNYFEESRKPNVGYFFDSSRTLVGRQSLQNRLMFMLSINDPWNNKLQIKTDDEIRVLLKKAFFYYFTNKVIVN